MNTMDDITAEFTTMEPVSPSATADYEDYPDYECDVGPVRSFRAQFQPPVFWLIALLGGAGNILVVWIYLNLRRRLKTMTDVYLLNLAVADLLFLVTLPLWAAEASGSWTFSSPLCRVTSALYKLNLFSSVLLLTCISWDRYVVIVQATKAQNSQVERRRCSKLVCVCVWLLALLLATPELIFSRTSQEGACRMVFPPHLGNKTKILVLSLQVSMGFCLPLVVMAFCYSVIVAKLLQTRSFQKHRALRVILAVVLAFTLSQLPYNTMLVMEAAQASNLTITACDDVKLFKTVEQVLQCVAYTHAMLNPFLYVFVGERFRRDVKQLLRVCHRRPGANHSQAFRSSTNKASVMSGSTNKASVMSDSETSQALSL